MRESSSARSTWCILLFLLFVFLVSPCFSFSFPDRILGGSMLADGSTIPLLQQIGATHTRVYMMWRYIQAEVKEIDASLRVETLRQNPDLIYTWSESVPNWHLLDRVMNATMEAGLTPIAEIGEGTRFGLPQYRGDLFDPNVVGEDIYLAYIYRVSRACVHRYKDRVRMWQTENELNEAWLAAFSGQRREDISGAWRKWSFLTTLLSTLRAAVKDEDPNGMTTMNFHTDIPKIAHDALFLKGFYLDAVEDWYSMMDLISFDAYPNYAAATPLMSNMVAERGKAIRDRIGDWKPIFVMETGYPVANNISQMPEPWFFSEKNQADWISQVVDSVFAYNLSGIMYFGVFPSQGVSPPEGGYTQTDIEAIQVFADAQRGKDLLHAVTWSIEHVKYLATRGVTIASEIEKGWGVVDSQTQQPRLGLDALRLAFSKYRTS